MLQYRRTALPPDRVIPALAAPHFITLVFTEVGALALMIAMFTGAVAVLVATFMPDHDCGNRFCRKRRRQEWDPPDRPH